MTFIFLILQIASRLQNPCGLKGKTSMRVYFLQGPSTFLTRMYLQLIKKHLLYFIRSYTKSVSTFKWLCVIKVENLLHVMCSQDSVFLRYFTSVY